jgi:hypothetical protein
VRDGRCATAVLACAVLLGCAQTGSYAPNPVTATYRLDNFSKPNLQIVVRDLRAERTNLAELISAIQSQIANALTERATAHSHYTLTVDVIEHRSFFTLGNWNALTRLKWRVQQGNGAILREEEPARPTGETSAQPEPSPLLPIATEEISQLGHWYQSSSSSSSQLRFGFL